jgi:hypothetical protein
MGQCISGKPSKVGPNRQSIEDLNRELEEVRTLIVAEIHTLHKISLDCKTGIDTCIIANNKQLAVLLKMKQNHLKNKNKLLQDSVKKIDEVLSNDKFSKKREIINETKKIIEDINGPLIDNDVSKLLEDNTDYNTSVLNELKKITLNFREIEASVEKEFTEKNSSPGRAKRRRYNKRHESS